MSLDRYFELPKDSSRSGSQIETPEAPFEEFDNSGNSDEEGARNSYHSSPRERVVYISPDPEHPPAAPAPAGVPALKLQSIEDVTSRSSTAFDGSGTYPFLEVPKGTGEGSPFESDASEFFRKDGGVVLNEVEALEEVEEGGPHRRRSVVGRPWMRRGSAAPQSTSGSRNSVHNSLNHFPSYNTSATPRSSVCGAYDAGVVLSSGSAPRMAATTAPMSVATPLASRRSISSDINSSSSLMRISTARPSIVEEDVTRWVDQDVRLGPATNAANQDLFTRDSGASYVAALAASMSAMYFPIQCAPDISRVAAAQRPFVRHLKLQSMCIDANTVYALMQYDHEVAELVDLLFENCTFAVESYTWLRELRMLKSLRVKGHYVTSTIIESFIANAPQLQSLTIFECSPLTSLEVLNDAQCNLQAIQIIHTNFTSEAFEHIVNCQTIKEVMLFQIDIHANIFDLMNTDHIELLQLVSCPDMYYVEKPRDKWLSKTSPRVGRAPSQPLNLSLRVLVIAECESINVASLPWSGFNYLSQLSIMYQKGLRVSALETILAKGTLHILRLQQVYVDEKAIALLQRSVQLRELNLSFCRCMNGLNQLWPVLPSLFRLNLSYSDIESEDLAALDQCTKLREIYARGCKYLRDFSAFRSVKHLELLDLTACIALENKTFFGPFESHRLVKLVLDKCPQINDISPFHALPLEVIKLVGTGVHGAGFEALQSCKYIRELDLTNCTRLECLDAFHHFHRLKRLCLRNSGVCDESLGAVAKCESLEELDLSYCERVFDIGALKTASSLLSLDLSYSAVTDPGIATFVSCTEGLRLRSLNLSGCTGIHDISGVAALDTLVTLMVCRSGVDNRSVEGIGRCSSLEYLDMSECPQITSVVALQQLERLRYLNLSLASIADDSVAVLGKCKSLEHLELSGCEKVTDVSSLSALTFLERLNVSATSVYAHTMEGLFFCPLLWDVNITNCANIYDISIIGDTKTIQRVDASGTKVADISFMRPWRCTALEELILRDSVFLKLMLPTSLQGITGLMHLDLTRSGIRDVCLATVATCVHLEVLTLDGCANLINLEPLAVLRNLRSLSAVDTNIIDASFDGLSLCGELTYANFARCRMISDVSSFARSARLRSLNLSRSSVTDLSFTQNWGKSQLLFLDLAECDAIEGLPLLSTFPYLQELNLSNSAVSDVGISHVAGCPRLRVLNVSRCQFFTTLAPLRAMPTLKSLDASLSSVQFVSEMGHLWEAAALQTVDLSYCRQLKSVSALCELPQLQSLHLSGSGITNTSFASCWEKAVCLEEINLDGCEQISNVDGLNFVTGLTRLSCARTLVSDMRGLGLCHQLEVLDLTDCLFVNDISPLRALPRLQQLRLRGCSNLSDVSFAEPWTCPALLELDLGNCTHIRSAKGIGTLRKLKNFDGSRTAFTGESIAELCQCQSLEQIDFHGCEHLRNFTQLAKLPQLRVLHLYSTGIDDNSIVSLSRCQRLEYLDIIDCPNVRNMFVPFQFGSLHTLRSSVLDSVVGSFLTACPSLESLTLQGCPRAFRVASLQRLSHLRVLDLSDGDVDDSLFTALENSAGRIEELYLSNCPNITKLDGLESMRRLRIVDLSEVPIEDSALKHLGACRTLQELRLRRCPGIHNIAPLVGLLRLRILDLTGAGIIDKSFTALTQLPSLEEVSCRYCPHLKDCALLYAGLPRVHTLDLRDTKVRVDEQALLRHSPHLENILYDYVPPRAPTESREREPSITRDGKGLVPAAPLSLMQRLRRMWDVIPFYWGMDTKNLPVS